MQNDKNIPRNLSKMAETIALIVVPLVIVLMAGVLLRSLTTEPVAQAKNAPTQLPENTPVASEVDFPVAYQPLPASEVPNASFQSVTTNGVTVYAGNYRLMAGELLADVCFDMPDESDWMIWQEAPVADEQGYSIDYMSGIVIEIRYPPKLVDGKMKHQIVDTINPGVTYRDAKPDKKIGQRCDTLGYPVPERFDTSSFTLTVKSIARNPSESDTCNPDTEYLKKLQAALDKKNSGIKIKNIHTPGEGGGASCGRVITEKPEGMTDAQAQALVSSQDMFLDIFGIRGPWVFEGGIK